MGQDSILAWFKQRAAIGGNGWLTFKEVRDGLREAGLCEENLTSISKTNRQLKKLIKFNYLEKHEPKGCSFRIKMRYPEGK